METKENIPPTFYDDAPDGLNNNMNVLKDLVKKRYDLLRATEERESGKVSETKYASYLQDFDYTKEEGLQNDIASHFILSLSYCKYESERSWFCLQESRLFQERLTKHGYDLKKTLQKLGIPLQEFDVKNNIHDQQFYENILFNQTKKQGVKANDEILFVPFEHALSLVPTHNYFIYKGNVYLPKSDLVNLIETVFSEKLQKNLQKIFNHYDALMTDTRIKYIVTQFEKEREAESFQKDNTTDSISDENKLKTAKDVDIYYKKAFPLCMYMIQQHIDKYSHLMHLGRLQYTLFLKGAGMPLDQCLAFFKKKYEKKTPGDKFEKQYAYNIRHSYGMEGKRTDYPPYSCRKVMNLNMPSSQECHGCPFKTYNEENLKQLIISQGLSEVNVTSILEKKRTGEFPLCCIKYFEAKFPGCEYEKVGVHPNHYFISAMKGLRKMNPKKIEYEKPENK